jgi:hypothetical protein
MRGPVPDAPDVSLVLPVFERRTVRASTGEIRTSTPCRSQLRNPDRKQRSFRSEHLINPERLAAYSMLRSSLGQNMEPTESLIDASRFLGWAEARGLVAVLHGHSHVPRAESHRGMRIIGCGSSVGKVAEDERGRTHMSMNVVVVDTAARRVSCRLRAERRPGAGFDAEVDQAHELIYSTSIA